MYRTSLPNPRELIIAKGTYKNVLFVTIGIIRRTEKGYYLVSTVGPKITWSAVTKWEYLSDVAPTYDIWGGASTPDSLAGLEYPKQEA